MAITNAEKVIIGAVTGAVAVGTGLILSRVQNNPVINVISTGLPTVIGATLLYIASLS